MLENRTNKNKVVLHPHKWDISQPSKMFIAREMLHKSRQYQIYRYHIDQILEI